MSTAEGFVSAGIAGILFAEDFGEPPPPSVVSPDEPAPPGLTEADLEAACHRAVRTAEQGWAESAAERRTAALEAIAAGLAELRRDARAEAEAVAEALAQAMLGVLAALLPSLCRAHGDAEVRALAREVLPLLGPGGRATVRARAEALRLIEADLAGMGEELAEAVQLRPASLPPGDLRLSWEGGGLQRDGAALCAAVEDCVSVLGLMPPPTPSPAPSPVPFAVLNPTPSRSLSHVE